jgi:UDP-N-acetylmuramate--alanine ligase
MRVDPYVPAAEAADLNLLALAKEAPIHFMGVCGAGMSALAEYIVRSGGQASGCDAKTAAAPPALEELGVVLVDGHDASHVEGAAAVVATAAVPASHPELQAARARGIPVLKRAVALGALVNAGQVVAVAGTHGKTTTTGMIGTALADAGLDPTAFVGGRVPGWRGGLRAGGSLFVVEADEYDRSFLALRPDVAVVTNLEPDHMEIYGDLDTLYDAFAEFLAPVPPHGLIAICTDDPGAAGVAARIPEGRVLSYGLEDGVRLQARGLAAAPDHARFEVIRDGESLGDFRIPLPGHHNVRNALATLAVAFHLGVSVDAARQGLARFGGIERRFQGLGEFDGVLVISDYAHHPTEVRATLAAARERFPGRRVVAVFQPHLYTRTRDHWRAFGDALAAADAVWATDIFPAREAPIEGVTGELVAGAARDAGVEVIYRPAIGGIADALAGWLQAGDVCVFMGAGDIDEEAHALATRLREERP